MAPRKLFLVSEEWNSVANDTCPARRSEEVVPCLPSRSTGEIDSKLSQQGTEKDENALNTGICL